ncbi:MAG: FG-GAP-like repeat-containing protein, partial [Planctomycetota bacterium]
MTSRPVEVGDLFVRRTFAVLIGLCALAFACRLHFASDEEIQQWAAARDLSTHSFTPARSTARELVQTNPDSDLNWLLFAEACAGLKLTEEALDAYGHVSPEQPELHTVALAGQGSRLLADGQMRAAEPFLKKAFQRSPNNLNVAGELAFLMRVQGRVWESTAPVRQLLIGSRFRGDEIHMLGSQLLQVSDEVYTNRSLTRNPDDPLPLLGKARLHLHNNELQQAQELISRILPVSTDILEVQAMQGWLLNEKGQDPQFLDWHANLPSRADDHPEIWFVRGQFLMRHGRPEESARCFLESLARSPNHYEATYRLSQVLTTLGQTEAAMYAGRRAQELAKVELAINELARGQTFEFMQKAVNQLARVQRYWEAAALCEIVRWLIPQEAAWARTQLRKYCPLIKDDHSFRPGWIPVPGIALQDFPLPDWSSSPDHMAPPSRESVETPLISFTENARDAGIDFSYFSGSPVSKGLGHIFETTGGGVAVLDLDADHWPDLWFAQGNAIWNDDTSGDWSDRIYRNHDGAHFTDVTELCRVQESNFSQGISVGDYDSDGFPDVYVGNVGPNCFFRNNGDGTFTEIAQQAGIAGNEWTLSPAIVDLNQDGHPEVYCVNYLQIEQVLARRCSRNGQPLTCAPSLFDAEQDRLYQNAGNGSFTDVTDDSGIVCPDGKGLSLI